MHYILRYIYLYIYVLYIAINISRITVDKYSGLLTIRGTSARFSTLLPLSFGCHRAQRTDMGGGGDTYSFPISCD